MGDIGLLEQWNSPSLPTRGGEIWLADVRTPCPNAVSERRVRTPCLNAVSERRVRTLSERRVRTDTYLGHTGGEQMLAEGKLCSEW